jgi:Protein kinase domain
MLGEVIHGYRVDRALSADKGGFGDVFFATHVESGAEAVVKVLKGEMSAHRDIVARFFNEARAAASVHHPGIVQIHNVGYHGDRAYLLMERLRGDDLETRLQGGPLPVERALVFLRQAAGAIGAAHERGIVHRDLKPANLFVVADPDVVGGERVKVLDFGIAKLTVDAGAGKTQGVFGTPAYMSPEQCASTGAVDARADLYSLGCIFYELVCGRPPFGQGGLELIAAHLRDTPMPPRALAPWLPPAIEQVILTLLEKQPERRYPSCAALVVALDQAAVASGLSGMSSPHLPSAGASATAQTMSPGSLRGTTPTTTLGAGAGAASVPPPRRRGVAGWLAGAVILAGAAAVVVVVLVMRDRQQPVGDPPRPALIDASVALLGADAALAVVTPDAALAVVPPDAFTAPDADVVAAITPDAPGPPDAPDGAEPPEPVDAGPNNRPPVPRPPLDPQAQLVKAGDAALRARRYDQALASYEEAEELGPNATAFAGKAAALLHLDRCGEAHQALLAANRAGLPVALANRARALRVDIDACIQRLIDSTPGAPPAAPENGCDAHHAEDLLTQAENQYRAGFPKDALAVLRKLLLCKQDARTYRFATQAACAAKDAAASQAYFAKVPAQYQAALVQHCQQQGITVRL